jgi:hypothetical protein
MHRCCGLPIIRSDSRTTGERHPAVAEEDVMTANESPTPTERRRPLTASGEARLAEGWKDIP